MSRATAVAVFGSSITEPGTPQWEEAYRVGADLARAGLAVVNGGYGGTMEAVSKGAAEAGGHVIGVISSLLFPMREGANRYVDEIVEATSLGNRIDLMMERAGATIALPGSIGTAAELILAWNTNYIARNGKIREIPSAAVGESWRRVGRALIESVGATAHHVFWADDADQAVAWVLERVS